MGPVLQELGGVNGQTGGSDGEDDSYRHADIDILYFDQIRCPLTNYNDEEPKITPNEHGFIGKPVQTAMRHHSQVFAIDKGELIKTFPELQRISHLFPPMLAIKIYEDVRLEYWAHFELCNGISYGETLYVETYNKVERERLILEDIQTKDSSIRAPRLYAHGYTQIAHTPCAFAGKFLLMEYFEPDEGVLLKEILENGDDALKARYYIQLREQVGKLHDIGIAHGNIRLENIVISKGKPWLVDFDHAFEMEHRTDVLVDFEALDEVFQLSYEL